MLSRAAPPGEAAGPLPGRASHGTSGGGELLTPAWGRGSDNLFGKLRLFFQLEADKALAILKPGAHEGQAVVFRTLELQQWLKHPFTVVFQILSGL